jgi:thiol:disulfide interchange protein DsbD
LKTLATLDCQRCWTGSCQRAWQHCLANAEKIPIGTLANYGYENTVLLPVPLTVASTSTPASWTSTSKRHGWCRKECIPQEGDFTLNLQSKAHRQPWAAAYTFTATPAQAAGSSQITVDGQV